MTLHWETVRTSGAIVPGQTARLASRLGASIAYAIPGPLGHVATFEKVAIDNDCLMKRGFVKYWFINRRKA